MLEKNNYLVFKFLFATMILSIINSVVGYNTFCTLDQNIDWNALSAISNFSMVIITAIAVCIAIIIPQKDRIESSKIELFQQRFEIYFQICQIIRRGFYEEGGFNKGGIQREFIRKLEQIKFLFEKSDYEELNSIINDCIRHPVEYIMQSQRYTSMMEILKKIDEIFEKYLSVKTYGKS